MSQTRMPLFADHRLFFSQFRKQFQSTGAVLPSSPGLARAITGPLRSSRPPARILEIGPGTGAITKRIVRSLGPEDQFDMVELNPTFAKRIRDRFEHHPQFRAVADRSRVHVGPIEEFETEAPYDYIVSGLPLNNFPSELVETVFAAYFDLLRPGGTISYFEYMYVRSLKRLVAKRDERTRLAQISTIADGYLRQHRFRRSWVFVNVPPAWVQHLRSVSENDVFSVGATSDSGAERTPRAVSNGALSPQEMTPEH